MNVKNKILLIALLLSLILSVGTAFATENITFDKSNLKTVSDENIEITQENLQSTIENPKDEKLDQQDIQNELSGSEYHVTGSDFNSIRLEMNKTQDGDTIFLDGKNYTGNSSIVVDKQLTIIGGSSLNDSSYAALDIENLNLIMQINAANVVIKNIKFINGNGDFGGAVFWKGGDGNLINCSFVGNNANFGGAISWKGKNCNIIDCSFINNSAIKNAGAIYLDLVGSCRVNNCSFVGNSADYGGAIYSQIFCTIANSSFINNSANTTAGAVSLAWGSSLLHGNEFINNSAIGTAGAIRIYSSGTTVINNTFQNNIGYEDGSIIWMEGRDHSIIDNFINNTNNDIAIYVHSSKGNIVIEDNVFTKDVNQVVGDFWVLDVYGNHEGYFGRPSNILVWVHDFSGRPADGVVHIDEIGQGTIVSETLIEGKANFNMIMPDYSTFLQFKIAYTSLNNTLVLSKDFDIFVNANRFNAISNISQSDDKVFVKCMSDATGMIVLDINGIKYFEDIHNGSAIFDISDLANGEYVANLIYSGDYKYSNEEQFIKIIVANHSTFTVIEVNDNFTGFAGNTIEIPVHVHDDLGNPLTGNVTLFGYGTQTLLDGKTIFNVKLPNAASFLTLALEYGDDIRLIQVFVENIPAPVYRISGNRDITVAYGGKATYQVLITKDGKAAGDETVTFNFNGQNINVRTDANGYARFNINSNIKPATYPIKVTCNGATVSNKVVISNIIKASDKKVKKSAKVTKIKISLKMVDGKYLKSKTLKIKFNGKTYKVKTNGKGVGTWKVKKSMLKKLKVGKNVKYTVTYGKDILTKKLIIKK